MDDRETDWEWAGVVAVAVTLGAVLAATIVSPAFQWDGNALSNLGVTTTAAGTGLTVLLFNGGLIAGGLFGVVFAVTLYRAGSSLASRATGVAFGLTTVLMGLVGVFPQDRPLHFPVAVGFYLLVSVTLWLDALAALRHGWRRRLTVAATLGVANLVVWLVWGLTGPMTRNGLAIPETAGALAFSAWTVWVSLGLIRGRWVGRRGMKRNYETVDSDTVSECQQSRRRD